MTLAMILGQTPTSDECTYSQLTLMSFRMNEFLRLRVTKPAVASIRLARPLVKTIRPLDSGSIRKASVFNIKLA